VYRNGGRDDWEKTRSNCRVARIFNITRQQRFDRRNNCFLSIPDFIGSPGKRIVSGVRHAPVNIARRMIVASSRKRRGPSGEYIYCRVFSSFVSTGRAFRLQTATKQYLRRTPPRRLCIFFVYPPFPNENAPCQKMATPPADFSRDHTISRRLLPVFESCRTRRYPDDAFLGRELPRADAG